MPVCRGGSLAAALSLAILGIGANGTAARLDRQVVALEVKAQDLYERLVAVVYPDGEDVNGWLVQQGNA